MTAPALGAGVHDIAPEIYNLDPCVDPSLSSSGIKRLLSGSPAVFASMHPRLTRWPELPTRSSKSMDGGTIAHAMVLGTACSFHFIDPQDCPARTKKGEPYKMWSGDAATWKAEQEAQGVKIGSRAEGARIQTAAQAMAAFCERKYPLWDTGISEVTLIWQRDTAHGPIWCRARIDRWIMRELAIAELKFTDKPITKRDLRKKLASEMLAIQIAWQMEGLVACYPNADLAGRIDGRVLVQELNPPYQTVRLGMTEARLHIARERINDACYTFAKCLRANDWPGEDDEFAPDPEDWEFREFEEEGLRA